VNDFFNFGFAGTGNTDQFTFEPKEETCCGLEETESNGRTGAFQ